MVNEAQTKAVESMALQDDEYFEMNEDRLLELRLMLSEALRGGRRSGPPKRERPTELPPVLAIAAPEVIELDRRDDIPLLIATRTTGLRNWQVDAEQNIRALLVDLRTGVVQTQRLSSTHKRRRAPKPSRKKPGPDELNAAAVFVNVEHQVGLRQFFGIRWLSSRYALTVMSYDWLSNTKVVELQGEELDSPPLAPRLASGFLSSLGIVDETPELDETGVALSVPERVDLRAPVPIHGSINLPATSVVLVPGADRSQGNLLIASLLLVKLDDEFPLQIDLAVPASLLGDGPEQRVESAFGFEIGDALQEKTLQGSYQVFLVVGDCVAGPKSFRLG